MAATGDRTHKHSQLGARQIERAPDFPIAEQEKNRPASADQRFLESGSKTCDLYDTLERSPEAYAVRFVDPDFRVAP
jgi:hypothetical protein